MRKPQDPAITCDLHTSWDFDTVHKKYKKEHFFCPICWEYHTMINMNGEMMCPKNDMSLGGLPKPLINTVFWHIENIEPAIKHEPDKYKKRIMAWLPFILQNRKLQVGYEQEQLTKKASNATVKSVNLQKENEDLKKQLQDMQQRLTDLENNQNNNGGGGVTPEAMDYLAHRISWSIGNY